jgi:hypothetical protein
MAWWNPLDYIPLSSDGKSVNALEAEQASIDQRRADLNARQLALGQISQEQFATLEGSRMADQLDVGGQIYGAAADGAAQGLKDAQSVVRKTATGIVSGAAGFLPWWTWLVVLALVFHWLGGFDALKGSLARKYAK